jgi:DNA-binding CsgD family transcriptional regulator
VSPPSDRSNFIGRQAELDKAFEVLGRAANGQSGLLAVMGEAGVGKSRFTREIRRRAQREDWWAFVGRCMDLEVGQLPYGPVVEGLRALQELPLTLPPPAGVEPDFGLRELFGSDQAGAKQAGEDHSQGRLRVFGMVLERIVQASRIRPLLIVLEDVHWADSSTLDLLQFLAHNLRLQRVLVVLTYRFESDLGARRLDPVLGELFRLASTTTIELTRFDRDDLGRLAAGVLGREVEPQLLDRLAERSDGNAFFAEELLNWPQFVSGGALPPHLSVVIHARLAGLSDDALAVVRAAATIGREAGDELLAQVCGLSEEAMAQALRVAVTAGVLVPGASGGYTFRHWLTKDVVYKDLLTAARPLHRAVAAALSDGPLAAEFGPATAAEIAAHWFMGGDLPAALAAAIQAGRLAAGVHAFAEAAGQFEQAVRLWDQVPPADRPVEPDHPELLQLTADAARWTGEQDRAVSLCRQAVAELEAGVRPGTETVTERIVVLLERLGRYEWEAGDSERSLQEYERARQMLPSDAHSRVAARILAGQAHMLNLRGQFQDSLKTAEQAAELAHELGAVGEESHALCTIGTSLGMLGDTPGAVRALRQALELARQVDSMEDICRSITNLSDILDFSGQLEEAAKVAQKGYQMTVDHRMELNAGGVMLGNAVSALRRLGRWAESAALAEPAVDRAPAGIAPPLHVSLGYIALGRGDLRTARRHAAAIDLLCARNTDPQSAGPMRAFRADMALAEHDLPAALDHVDTGLALLARSEEEHLIVKLCAIALRGLADHGGARPAGRRGAAEYLEAAVEAVAAQAGRGARSPEAEADLASARAEHARAQGTPAPGLWRDAASRYTELAEPYPRAYTRYRLAEALAGTVRTRLAAATEVEAALAEALQLGALPLAEEVEAFRRRGGLHAVRPPAAPEPDPLAKELARFNLTPRERQVLELLVAGASNRIIGRELDMKESTASVHVSNVLRKLGVANRTQAATLGRSLGIGG